MSRYIDAEKLCFEILEEYGISTGGDDVTEIYGMIINQPTADVVEADKAQKEIDYWHDKAQSYEQTILKLSLNKADVVEVVRCKDCKHYKTNIPCVGGHYNGCIEWLNEGCAAEVNEDDFCSYGEKHE